MRTRKSNPRRIRSRSRRASVDCLLVQFALAATLSLPAAADPEEGELDAFERELEEEQETSEQDDEECRAEDDDEYDVPDLLVDALAGIFVEGGWMSWCRVTGASPAGLEEPIVPREVGEPSIPFFNLDLAYQDEVGDIEAIEGRLEVGYGPFGADVHWTRYREHTPRDAHDFVEAHLLYRMTFAPDLEVDVGGGVYVIDGIHRHTGTSFVLPIWLQLFDGLSVESRLGWAFFASNNLTDHSFRLRLERSSGAIWAGYRRIATGGSTLRGPTFGISLYY